MLFNAISQTLGSLYRKERSTFAAVITQSRYASNTRRVFRLKLPKFVGQKNPVPVTGAYVMYEFPCYKDKMLSKTTLKNSLIIH